MGGANMKFVTSLVLSFVFCILRSPCMYIFVLYFILLCNVIFTSLLVIKLVGSAQI